jgi:hypothetical protein
MDLETPGIYYIDYSMYLGKIISFYAPFNPKLLFCTPDTVSPTTRRA